MHRGVSQGERQKQGTLLLVDDEPYVLSGIKAILHREPYQVLTTTSARECLHILGRTPVDVIVADEQMPGMIGSELLTHVARDYPATVRIMLTGHPCLEGAVRGINGGAIYRFLQKPYRSDQLAEVILDAFRVASLNRSVVRIIDTIQQELRRFGEQNSGPAHTVPGPWLVASLLNRQAGPVPDVLEALSPEERKFISPRERNVLELILAGHRVTEIAQALCISKHTVRNHLKSLFQKLDVHSQEEVRERLGSWVNGRLPG